MGVCICVVLAHELCSSARTQPRESKGVRGRQIVRSSSLRRIEYNTQKAHKPAFAAPVAIVTRNWFGIVVNTRHAVPGRRQWREMATYTQTDDINSPRITHWPNVTRIPPHCHFSGSVFYGHGPILGAINRQTSSMSSPDGLETAGANCFLFVGWCVCGLVGELLESTVVISTYIVAATCITHLISWPMST